MRGSRVLKLMSGLTVLMLVAAACGGGGGKKKEGETGTKGGTYRTAIEDFFVTDGMDPTGEYTTTGAELFGEMIIRNLVTFKHVAGPDGNVLVPDIAESIPEPSDDGLTYTFNLKHGIMFGPPLDREVTSHDIEYAFERINTKPLTALYGFYYNGVVEGMDGEAKSPHPISGIETPDDYTITFHLSQPAGDFISRLSMAATGPIPEEVAKCFDKAAEYGRYVISSGPYMYKGEGDLDISSCDTMKPISGFDPSKGMILVRNPNYDPDTDDPAVRENLLDGVQITVDANTDDIYNRIEQGDLDGDWQSHEPPQFVQRVTTDSSLGVDLHSNPDDGIYYLSMNLLTPPFDDVHVRKAANWVMDKAALAKVRGGSLFGEVAKHIFPPTVLSLPSPYDPYASPGDGGDVDKAKAEMKLSKYDSTGDGVCDDPACKNVVYMSCNVPSCNVIDPVVTESLAKIGIDLKVRELEQGAAYNAVQTVNNLIPMEGFGGWVKDYPDPYTYIVLFQSDSIICAGASNYSNIGMTAAQAKECGVTAEWKAAQPPSLDADVDACEKLSGDDRTNCWVEFDKKVMEEVVPWIPWQWSHFVTTTGSTVTKFEFDQNAATPSFVHMAVNNGIDPNTLTL